MQLYLAAAPDRLSGLTLPQTHIAYAAYGIGAEARLIVQPLPAQARGGLLMLSDENASAVENPEPLCRDIMAECTRRNYRGVVLDFQPSPAADRIALLRRMDALLHRCQLVLYVPEYYGCCVRYATVLLCTALSGGTLRDRLKEAAQRFAPRPIALDCQRLAMDFLIPSPNGEGVPLTIEQLWQLQQGRSPFFSGELCARYFTYRTASSAHFVLFDDGQTLLRKVQLGRELGVTAAFFMLPEVADVAGELFPSERKNRLPRGDGFFNPFNQ